MANKKVSLDQDQFQLAAQVTAVKVDSVGAAQRHDNPTHPNQGLVPVQFMYPYEEVPAGPHEANIAARQRNDLQARAALRMFPAGTVVKAGDYYVTVGDYSAFVDGKLFEAVALEVSA